MRERGIRDLAVLRAMEAVSRADFVAPRYASLATRDLALPIARGQSVPEPILVARMLVGSRLQPDHRALLVGLGSGYTTAVLSHLVRDVVAVDRLPSLVHDAGRRLSDLGRNNVEVACRDGLAITEIGAFARILLVGVVDRVPEPLWRLLAPEGSVIYARAAHGAISDDRSSQTLVRAERQADGIARQTILGPSRLGWLQQGQVIAG